MEYRRKRSQLLGKLMSYWRDWNKDIDKHSQRNGSTGLFNHAGDGVIMAHYSEHTLRVFDYPSLASRESPAAHVGGCGAVALDPRGR